MYIVGLELVWDTGSSVLFFFLGSEVPLAAHVLLITTQQVLEPGRKKNNTACRKKKYSQNFEDYVERTDIGANVPQSGPKGLKLAHTVQDNLDGPKWSNNLVSRHRPQNSNG